MSGQSPGLGTFRHIVSFRAHVEDARVNLGLAEAMHLTNVWSEHAEKEQPLDALECATQP